MFCFLSNAPPPFFSKPPLFVVYSPYFFEWTMQATVSLRIFELNKPCNMTMNDGQMQTTDDIGKEEISDLVSKPKTKKKRTGSSKKELKQESKLSGNEKNSGVTARTKLSMPRIIFHSNRFAQVPKERSSNPHRPYGNPRRPSKSRAATKKTSPTYFPSPPNPSISSRQ